MKTKVRILTLRSSLLLNCQLQENLKYTLRYSNVFSTNHWSFAEKTFVKQSMMLCAFEILLKIGRSGGVNCTDDLRGKLYR